MSKIRAILFDWGDTLMHDEPAQTGPMADWPSVAALPGAQGILQWARKIGPVGIASGAQDSDSLAIRAALARVNLADYIDHVFCRRELGLAKTDPRFWAAISAALDLPARQIVMVGDNYDADVLAAQAAGLLAVWFNWRGLPPHPCPTISTLQELPQMIAGNLLES